MFFSVCMYHQLVGLRCPLQGSTLQILFGDNLKTSFKCKSMLG